MSKRITLGDCIADMDRELMLRLLKYPEWQARETDPRKRAALREKHDHQIACARDTINRLRAMLPQQTSLFA